MAIDDRRGGGGDAPPEFSHRDRQPDRRPRGGQGGSVDADHRLEANVLANPQRRYGACFSCRADELIGVDLRSLGLPKPSTFSGSPGRLFWPYGLHPLESLPQSRIRIASGPRNAALAAPFTNDPIEGLALAATRAGPQP